MKPLLTIVIPVYKVKEAYLKKCIESVLDANCDEVSIILVDDGSPDHCGSICDDFAKENHSVTVLHQTNQGVSAARNAGMQASDSTWIMFVDSDDWIETSSLGSLCRFLKSGTDHADIVLCNYIDEFATESVSQKFNAERGFLNDKDLRAVRLAPFYKLIRDGIENHYSLAVVWNKVYRTSFLQQNGIVFPVGVPMGEDRILNAEAMFKTENIINSNITIYHYRWISSSTTNSFNPKITENCLKELYGLKQVLLDNNRYEETEKYFLSRVCTRAYSCMRLYFFNKQNRVSYNEKKRELKRFLLEDIFQTAYKKVDGTLLTLQEKIFVFGIKRRLYFMCYILVALKSRTTHNKLENS